MLPAVTLPAARCFVTPGRRRRACVRGPRVSRREARRKGPARRNTGQQVASQQEASAGPSREAGRDRRCFRIRTRLSATGEACRTESCPPALPGVSDRPATTPGPVTHRDSRRSQTQVTIRNGPAARSDAEPAGQKTTGSNRTPVRPDCPTIRSCTSLGRTHSATRYGRANAFRPPWSGRKPPAVPAMTGRTRGARSGKLNGATTTSN